jgi:lambda family phage portal protein
MTRKTKRPTASSRKRKHAVRRVRKAIVNTIHASIGRVQNAERAALLAGDTELSAAIKLASGMRLTDQREQQAAASSGMFGNVFAARFDSAQTTSDNANHWSMADGLASDAAANPMIRYVLRNRSRYETANNCYARGMVNTVSTDLVGTGPRLQMETGSETADEWLELEFSRWMRQVKIADKLRIMAKAKVQDGEVFCLLISNNGSPLPVKLDLRPIEADQCRFVDISLLSVPSVDGIRFDDFGNPVSYHILRVHPGFWSYATGYIGFPWEYDVWPAKYVLHWYRSDRPGQHRGLPEIMAALPLLAQVRRYILAVLQAAETAADFAMWMKTPTAAEGMTDSDDVVEVPNPFDLFPLQRNIVTTLPDGYEIGQTKPNQPVDRIEDFVRVLLRQIARVINMPYNVVSGDFSQGSYSESNLGNQGYFRQIDEGRKDLEYSTLDRLFAAWLFEARNARIGNGDFGEPYMPAEVRQAIGKFTGNACNLPTHTWNWVGHEWANPAQAAQADQMSLRMGTKSYANVCGRMGSDYRKIHLANAKALGMTIEEYREEVLRPNLLEKPQPPEQPETPEQPEKPSAEEATVKDETADVEKA